MVIHAGFINNPPSPELVFQTVLLSKGGCSCRTSFCIYLFMYVFSREE